MVTGFHGLLWYLNLAALSLLVLPLLAGGFAYREALPGYPYQFPRDHFEHKDFRTEWWYYTGNVTDADGKRFGFELVFFRQGERHATDNKSAWAVQDVYLAHAALTDANGKRFWYEERLNRTGPGVAGASFEGSASGTATGRRNGTAKRRRSTPIADHFRFHLAPAPAEPFVIQGENGSARRRRAAAGRRTTCRSPCSTSRAASIRARVKGRAWMDHEWFTEQLAADQVGWDWFSVQLDNRTELMLFELRRKDGSIDPYSSGHVHRCRRRSAHHLRREDFTLRAPAPNGEVPD